MKIKLSVMIIRPCEYIHQFYYLFCTSLRGTHIKSRFLTLWWLLFIVFPDFVHSLCKRIRRVPNHRRSRTDKFLFQGHNWFRQLQWFSNDNRSNKLICKFQRSAAVQKLWRSWHHAGQERVEWITARNKLRPVTVNSAWCTILSKMAVLAIKPSYQLQRQDNRPSTVPHRLKSEVKRPKFQRANLSIMSDSSTNMLQ